MDFDKEQYMIDTTQEIAEHMIERLQMLLDGYRRGLYNLNDASDGLTSMVNQWHRMRYTKSGAVYMEGEICNY